jgi:dipeptidyl-peptidase-4
MKISNSKAQAITFAGCFAAGLVFAVAPSSAIGSEKPTPTTKSSGKELTVERVSAEPDRDDRSDSLRWSLDGGWVAWMRWQPVGPSTVAATPQREIWTLQSSSGKESDQEGERKGEREREKSVLLLSASTVTRALQGNAASPLKSLDDDDINKNPYLLKDFAWFKGHGSLLLIGAQAIARIDMASGKSRVLVFGEEPISDATLSPDEKTVSFILGHKLWVVPVQEGAARVLTPAQSTGVLEGEVDWTYRNELHLNRGYAWSPDSSRIAYLETDDRAVTKYTIGAVHGASREIAYPTPGGKIPTVRVLIRNVSGGASLEVKLGPTRNQYLPRIAWLPDGRHLAIERLDRLQHSLQLVLADSVSGSCTTLIDEKDEYWINLSDILYFFKDGKGFLWSSERSGFRHLYLYDLRGHELSQVTHGDWEVTRLNAVDEATSTIYFTATEKSPLERHLYQIHLDGSSQSRVTLLPGTHEIFFAPTGSEFVDIHSSATTPPRLSLGNLHGPLSQGVGDLTANPNSSIASQPRQSITHHDQAPTGAKPAERSQNPGGQAGIQPDEQPGEQAGNEDGDQATLPALQPITFLPIQLHLGSQTSAILLRPPDFDPSRKYPVILYLAGGPGEQLVRDAWGGATGLWMQMMAQKGFLVFALDNHGTTGRGHYFEHPIHLRLGAQELADQRDGLVYLSSLPYVDMKRLGVCGWGYGGFLVLHAMLDRPVAFKAGFAGAPIADWRLYDATFAERYLDDAIRHEDGWLASLAFENDSPKFFKGKLMVAQATGDEFVHLENTFLIQDEMLKAGKSADLLLFPDSGHLIEEPRARLVLFQKMTDFFVINL